MPTPESQTAPCTSLHHKSLSTLAASVKPHRRFVPLLLASSLAVLAAPAFAQQTDDTQATLQQINVTGKRQPLGPRSTEQLGGYSKSVTSVATKSPATLRQIPQSVSIVTRKAIDDRNYTSLDQMAYTTPGLRVLDSGKGRSSIYSRGFEYSEYNINGLPAPMSSILGTLPSLAAFDRVEILRGPAGLYNATSEMGGIINLVLKKPTKDFQGHVIGRYGSFNSHQELVDLSGSLSPQGAVRGRMVLSNQGTDTENNFDDANNNQTYYGTTQIDLTDSMMLTLAVLRQERELTQDSGVPTGPNGELLDFPDDTFVGADWNHFEMDSTDVIAQLTNRLDDGSRTRIGVRYSDRNAGFNYIFGGGALQPNNTLKVTGLGGALHQKTWSVDANYYHPFSLAGMRSSVVIGTDFKRYETDLARVGKRAFDTVYLNQINDYPYLDILGPNPKFNTTILETHGVYSKVTVHPLEGLALIGGMRLGAYDIQTEKDARADTHKWTPYVGVTYDLNSHNTLYASYTEVFKPQTALNPKGELLKPREGHQYEIGLKSSFFAGQLHTRLTAFNMKDRNAGVPAAPHTRKMLPLGERRVRGIEAEVSGSVTDNLDIILGYTYLSTKVEEGTGKSETIFMLMPKNRANLWGVYHFDGNLNGLETGLGVSAMGHFGTLKGIEAPGYMTVGAMVGYQFNKHLSARLNAKNLLDKEYYRRVGSFGTFNARGAPRRVMATLRYDF